MYINNITFSSTELNTNLNVKKDITDRTLTDTEGIVETYRPTRIDIANNTGNTINFGLFTTKEYAVYIGVSGSSYTDLIPLANGSSKEIINIEGEITAIVVSGAGSYSSGCTFVVHQEH